VAETGVVDTVETQVAVRALNDLRSAWVGQLNDLIAMARSLATADDTYEFVKRPNIPYVDAHYDPEYLAANRIDTVLIVNLHGTPLFWRRVNQGANRGFPDARLFLAELPPLATPGVTGVPTLAGAATLLHGTKLLVAMPICAARGSGATRGWLIVTRALDAHQWHRYEELAHIPVQLLDPATAKSHGADGAAFQEPLTPFVRLEAKNIRGFMAVPDLRGRPFRVFSVSLERQDAGAASSVAPYFARSMPWVFLMVAMTSLAVAGGVTGFRRHQSRGIAYGRQSAPQVGNALLPIDGATSRVNDRVVARVGVSASASASASAGASAGVAVGAVQARDPLRDRLAAKNAVFRYQPQIDLQTGRVAGVEALLCISVLDEWRPAIQLIREIEAAGLGLALAERRLRDACRAQHSWLKIIGHEFPIGVPVSQHTLVNAAFLPLVQRILAENELAPPLLELEVEGASLGPSAATLRSIGKVRDTGISIAIDGFDAANSNLRLLSILPVSKLRLDPWLLLRIGDGPSEALLFDGILGAARGLGIVVCASGIDSPALLASVLRHGRPLAQGAAVGVPVSEDEFLELLRGSSADTVVLRPLSGG
jgi:EAL domain-containing protein (putative c-di-GMP-specific phosphodiesterase class I)/sensor domain CHASE-containing protein